MGAAVSVLLALIATIDFLSMIIKRLKNFGIDLILFTRFEYTIFFRKPYDEITLPTLIFSELKAE